MEEKVRSAGGLGFIAVVLQLAGLATGGVLTLVGFITELIALKRLAETLNSGAIWNNALKAVATALVGGVVVIALLIAPLSMRFVHSAAYSTYYLPPPAVIGPNVFIAFAIAAGLWVTAYIFFILSGEYFKNAYGELAAVTGVEDFKKAAKWTWLGVVLFIVIIGGILALIGRVYALAGYSALKNWKRQQTQ